MHSRTIDRLRVQPIDRWPLLDSRTKVIRKVLLKPKPHQLIERVQLCESLEESSQILGGTGELNRRRSIRMEVFHHIKHMCHQHWLNKLMMIFTMVRHWDNRL